MYWSVTHKPSEAVKDAAINQVANEIDEEEEEKILDEEEIEREEKKQETNLSGNLMDKDASVGKYWAYEDNGYIKFHFFMMLFAIYLSPVFSNWGNSTVNGSTWNYGNEMTSPFYIKLATCFGGMFLYLWTVIAPVVLTEREFAE